MKHLEQVLRIFVIITLCLSGLLLGMSQGDFQPLLIAVISAVAAWVLVDNLRWFSLPQWLANGLAIIVTVFTIASFLFTGDPVRQLLGVGKLLVYLQSILLFQRKSARLYWQILVLGLLQIVVGAVFNLGFEGGVLFILYVTCGGFTMLLLHLFQQREIAGTPGGTASRSRGLHAGRVVVSPMIESRSRTLRRMASHYAIMGLGALVFGFAWFYFLPREHSSWSGPVEVPMRPAGYQQSVSSNHSDLIPMSTQVVMTVQYARARDLDPVPLQPEEMPCLRGIALAGVVTEGNATTWQPAASQVLGADFHPLAGSRRWSGTLLVQKIVLEPTDNPLIYSLYPAVGIGGDEDENIEFCWPVGCLTRERSGDKIKVAHYRYELGVVTRRDGTAFEAWPYQSRTGRVPLTADADPGVYRWLTHLERNRYPDIVGVAGDIAARTGDNHARIARECEAWFSPANGFSYTVDFRSVRRDSSIDGVEDFFANHRTGHCVYYASALALMLRSQGIPSRVVVGYRGGQWNDFGKHIDVEARNAHAWVEAYIRPDDCPESWRASGEAGRLGAWMTLDATPAIDFDQLLTSNALNYAQSFWRDYVLGLQADQGATTISRDGFKLSGFLKMLDLGWWQANVTSAVGSVRQPGPLRNYLLVAVPIVLLGIAGGGWFWWRRQAVRKGTRRTRAAVPRGFALRSRFASLAAGISPALARWLAPNVAGAPPVVPFYQRMTKILERAGRKRLPGQTHLEFANQAGRLSGEGARSELAILTTRITRFYYLVRFGGCELDENQQILVEQSLDELERKLAGGNSAATTATDAGS